MRSVDTWALDDADAKRRARHLAGLLSPEHRVRACRYEEPHKALIGLRAFGCASFVDEPTNQSGNAKDDV